MKPTEWFADETFWEAFAPFMFDDTRWMLAEPEVEGICRLTGIEPPAEVLDLCCGVGRHSLVFARKGFRVTGVDITASYLEAARESALAEGLELSLIHADARRFSRPGAFALCVNLGASFGYFSDPNEDLALLRRCRKNLAPRGFLVLETIGKETAARSFVPEECIMREGWEVRAQYSIVGEWEKLGNRWTARKGGTIIERQFDIRLYSALELRMLLARAGFGNIRIFGSLAGSPYDQDADMLVATAQVQG